ncbi:MAG: glycoside hydrolase family 92 protein, partial [Armatimonadetes bacterium]|nr:glycoside hydrolase family 92 protein [Armatimonadota bacterium]
MPQTDTYEPIGGAIASVNVLCGTDSRPSFSTGNTLPLISAPHGMTHWTPQTGDGNDRWFFSPGDRVFSGIRATHQPSPWMSDYGQFVLMPQSGDPAPEAWRRSSAYVSRHHRPDYFCADLLKDGWQIRFAPTMRGAVLSAMRRDTDTPCRLIVERFDNPEPLAWDKSTNRVTGFTRKNSGGVTENWAHYFVLDFDAPVVGVSEAVTGDGHALTLIEFAPETQAFTARIGTSFIGAKQAVLNLTREVGTVTPEEVATATGGAWNALLERFTLTGATDAERRIFYSCLYRALLFPRVLHEPDAHGEPFHFSPYTGAVLPGVLYGDNGFWDTFRTVYPLLSLAYPDILGGIIDGWLQAYRESGFLPEWSSPGHRSVMIGTHSQAVIADAVAKGITGFDYETALEAVVKGATSTVPDDAGYGRAALAEYDALGYVPCDRISKATSRTLDYAYDDYCVAQVARVVGRGDLHDRFMAQSERWRNVFDAETRFFRARNTDGSWQTPFDPFVWGGAFVEGSAYQFRFSVPHDPHGLAALFGGADALAEAVADLLETPPVYRVGSYGQTIHEMTEMATANFGQYAHSNQPVHATLHMAAAVGRSDITNRLVRRVLTEYYTPDTFPGDEDNGEMAAWYILAAIGLFPLCPGSGEYVLNAPLFAGVSLQLPGGKTLRIETDDVLVETATAHTAYWNDAPV